MHIAKKIIDKPQWILLKETYSKGGATNNESINCNNTSGAANAQRKKKKNAQQNQQTAQKSNLKQSPFNIDDGDLIAFTISETTATADSEKQITAGDFMSAFDIECQKKFDETCAEVSRTRKERKKTPEAATDKKSKANRRPEVGITIKIDDFNECSNN